MPRRSNSNDGNRGASARGLWGLGLVLGSGALVIALSCRDDAAPDSETSNDAGTSDASGSSAADSEPLPYHFVDATESSGLSAFRQENGRADKLFIVGSFGAGVALFDADGDDDLDAYLTNGSHLEGLEPGKEPRDALFLNDGSGHFTDGTAAAGLGDTTWTTGVRTVDIEGDGDLDLYLTNYGPNALYLNQGDGTFRDVTDEAGVGDPGWSTGACFFDHDNDGDLDLYVVNYIVFDEEGMLRDRPVGTIMGHRTSDADRGAFSDVKVMKGPRGLPPARDRFYINEGEPGGPPRYRDASAEMGIDGPEAFGFQCIAFDADRDGWVDIYVANDVIDNFLWHNEGGKGFVDYAMRTGSAVSMNGTAQGGMGASLGDFDGDLWPDLYVTNYVDDYSTLYRGGAGGFFTDMTTRVRLNEATWSMVGWGCDFVDFDNDGDLEVFVVNGHVYPQVDGLELGTEYKQLNLLFEYDGKRFYQPRGEGGPGFALRQATRGAAVGDVDGDGDLDLLFGNLDDTPTLLRNDGPSGSWARVRLFGPGGNRDAVGARVVARVDETAQLRLAGIAGSFLSSSDPRLHFGLGDADRIDELEITWPDGTVDTFTNLAAGRTHTFEQAERGQPGQPVD